MPLISKRKLEVYLIIEDIFKEALQLDIISESDKLLTGSFFIIYSSNKKKMDLLKTNISDY